MEFEIAKLDLWPAAAMRVELDETAIAEYAENLDQLPPIIVQQTDDYKLHLIDGRHRVEAAKRIGRTTIYGVTLGEIGCKPPREMFKAAARANDIHGVRVTKADKRKRVEAALAHPKIGVASSRMIAKYCSVSHTLVDNVRESLGLGVKDEGESETSRLATLPTETSSSEPTPAPMRPESATHSIPKRIGRDGKQYKAKKPTPKVVVEPTPPKPLSYLIGFCIGPFERSAELYFDSAPLEDRREFIERASALLDKLRAKLADQAEVAESQPA